MRVLIVDDHALFLEGIRNLLASEGIQVAGTARDGLEALEKARALRPDVILMDIQMPRCNGLAATRLIKAESPEIKIVMLTMSEDEQDLFEAVKSGASGYLLKRLDAEDFFRYLSDLEAGQTPFSPGLAAMLLKEYARQAAQFAQTPTQPAKNATPNHVMSERGGVLSARQMQILTLVAQGQTYRRVAETIGIAERTVKYHMGEILERLHLDNRNQVIAYATQMGLIRGQQDDPP